MKLTSKTLAALIFGILFGGITITTVLGWWGTRTTKEPVKYTEGEVEGQYNPADIRGSYNFGDINRLFEVPLEDLAVAFRLPADVDPATFQVKALETQFSDLDVEIGTASVRLFVAWYKHLPYDPDEETYLLSEAVDLLRRQDNLNSDQISYLELHTIDLDAVTLPQASSSVSETTPAAFPDQAATSLPDPISTLEHVPTEGKITGKTTFQELIDWGVSQADIEKIIGETMPSPSTIIKDYATQKGEEFLTLKTDLQAQVDLVSP